MVLGGNNQPAGLLLNLGEDRLTVQRLDGRGVQNGNMEAFLLQFLSGVQSTHGHLAAGDHQSVIAIAQQLGLADLKMIIILIQHDGNTVAAQQTHIHGALKLGYGFGSLHHFHCIAGIDNSQVGHGSQNRQIICCLMAGAVAGLQAGQAADNLHIGVVLADGLRDKVIASSGDKSGISSGEGDEALLGQAAGSAHHQLLGHTHVVKPIRKFVAEHMDVCIFCKVGTQTDDLVVFLSQFNQCFTEGFTHCRVVGHNVGVTDNTLNTVAAH